MGDFWVEQKKNFYISSMKKCSALTVSEVVVEKFVYEKSH